MSNFKLKPTHAPVKEYYATLSKCAAANFDNEGNVRRAFVSLLEKCARAFEWFVVAEYPIPRTGRNPLKADAAILDAFNLPRGYWEAKDEKNSPPTEMNKKFAEGYPRTNPTLQKSPTPPPKGGDAEGGGGFNPRIEPHIDAGFSPGRLVTGHGFSRAEKAAK